MSSLLQRRCACDGCRFAATPSSRFCQVHRPPAPEPLPPRSRPAPSRQRDDYAVSVILRQDLTQIAGESLDAVALRLGNIRDMTREIGILRLLLERTVADGLAEGDARALARTVMPLVAEIGRALRTNEQIKDGERDVLAEAIKLTLIEHGKSLKL